jgi:hypothetical protein
MVVWYRRNVGWFSRLPRGIQPLDRLASVRALGGTTTVFVGPISLHGPVASSTVLFLSPNIHISCHLRLTRLPVLVASIRVPIRRPVMASSISVQNAGCCFRPTACPSFVSVPRQKCFTADRTSDDVLTIAISIAIPIAIDEHPRRLLLSSCGLTSRKWWVAVVGERC